MNQQNLEHRVKRLTLESQLRLKDLTPSYSVAGEKCPIID